MPMTARQDPNRCLPYPGEVIQDTLDDLDYTKSSVARMLGISRQQRLAILSARKQVSPEMAAASARCSATAPPCGCVFGQDMMPGTRNVKLL